MFSAPISFVPTHEDEWISFVVHKDRLANLLTDSDPNCNYQWISIRPLQGGDTFGVRVPKEDARRLLNLSETHVLNQRYG